MVSCLPLPQFVELFRYVVIQSRSPCHHNHKRSAREGSPARHVPSCPVEIWENC